LIDEAQSVFSPRWTAKDIAALDFPGGHDAAAAAGRPATWNDALEMHRHFGWDMILTTPNIRSLRADVREVAEGAYKHRNLAVIGWRGRYMEGFHDAQDSGLPNHMVTLVSKKISKEVWSLYDSTATGSFADTLAGIKLWKDPKILALLAVFAFALFMAFRNPLPAVLGGKKTGDRPSHPPPPSPSSPPVPTAPPPTPAIHGNSDRVAGVSPGAPGNVVSPPPNESPWQVIGHYQANGKHYVTLRRDNVMRTIVNPKGATYDGIRTTLQLDGHYATAYTGAINPGGMGIGKL
ncbi:MAG: zonular occludens toxin domain-containing protein, partial [Sulfuricellaceae bacterium]